MRLIASDFKKGNVKLKIDTPEDLWYLSQVLDKGDFVTGKATRKINLSESSSKSSVVKKTITLKIEVEKQEFQPSSNILRLLGIVRSEIEDIPKGSHHSINIEIGSIISINKQWLNYQIKRLKEASENKKSDILIVVLDRSDASFALLTSHGYEYLSELEGEVENKRTNQKPTKNFYLEVIEQLNEYVKRLKIKTIILASPSFWKEDLLKEIESKNIELANIIRLASCNVTGKAGIEEVLSRTEVKQILKQDRVIIETDLVDHLLMNIAKETLSSYGLRHVEAAVNAGAVSNLLITDKTLLEHKEKGEFDKIEKLMRDVESSHGEVIIISTEHDAGKKLQGLSGIGAILRYEFK
ncbi:MAG: mRNA surveillance protein pelota [Candidatus Nanoarchaeia archaeon]|nr:mRNA surveillance protein pelota [Candidatus Nanoarchaeia archaeon]